MMEKKTDAVSRLPRSTDSTDEEFEGKSGNVNPKVAIDNNLQLSENSVSKNELKRASSTEILLYNRSNSQSEAQNGKNTPDKYYESFHRNKAYPEQPSSNPILKNRRIAQKPFLIPRIMASKTGNELVIFSARPIYRRNTPLLNPAISKSVE